MMPKIIYKHILKPNQEELVLPYDSEILSVAAQKGHVVLYEEHSVYQKGKTETRKIKIVPTGIEFPRLYKKFLGTVSLDNGIIMLHIFEY